jgi:hypothetical protein
MIRRALTRINGMPDVLTAAQNADRWEYPKVSMTTPDFMSRDPENGEVNLVGT